MNQVVASHEGEPGARRNDSRADRAHGSTHVTRWHDHRLHSRAALETSVSASAERRTPRPPGDPAPAHLASSPTPASAMLPRTLLLRFPSLRCRTTAPPCSGVAPSRTRRGASTNRTAVGEPRGIWGRGSPVALRHDRPEHLDGSLVECPVVDDDRHRSTHETLDPPGGRRRTDDDVHTPHEPTERAPGGRTGLDPRDVR